jgi:Zn-dependent protease
MFSCGLIAGCLVLDIPSIQYKNQYNSLSLLHPFTFPSTKPTLQSYVSYQLKRRQNQRIGCFQAVDILHLSSTPNNALPDTNSNDVDELRRRAEELRQEAHLLEMALQESKLRKKSRKEADIQSWINLLFVDSTRANNESMNSEQKPQQQYGLPNASVVARALQTSKLTEEQILLLMQNLYQRRNMASLTQDLQPQTDSVVWNESNTIFNTYATDNRTLGTPINQTETDLMSNYMQLLLDALTILDQSNEPNLVNNARQRWSGRLSSQLTSKLKEWSRMDELDVRRRMNMRLLQTRRDMSINKNLSTLGEMPSTNSSISGETIKYIPRWIPPSLYTTVFLSKEGRLDPLDILAIKERVLTRTRFFCTSSDSFLNIAIYRGNMRPGPSTTNAIGGHAQNFSAIVFDEIQTILEIEGLAHRVQLFLLNDPDWRPNADMRESRPKPVIVALPKSLTPYENTVLPSRRMKSIQEMSFIFAVCTIIIISIRSYALNPVVFDGLVNRHDIHVLSKCLPLSAIILSVQFIHEVAHQIMARKHGIITRFPIPIPSTVLGTFGCITRIRSFPPSRMALFDFAISGPLAAMVLSLSLMVIGCFKTIHASKAILTTFPTIPLANFKSSFLTGTILTAMLPKVMMLPSAHPIPIHPLFVGGYTTLIVSALNMLPMFRLDGGRACTAILGTRLGALTSAWTMLSLLSLGLSGSGLAWTWGAFVLFFQRQPEIISRDEITPVGKLRTVIWAACLAISLLTLLPFPGGIFL